MDLGGFLSDIFRQTRITKVYEGLSLRLRLFRPSSDLLLEDFKWRAADAWIALQMNYRIRLMRKNEFATAGQRYMTKIKWVMRQKCWHSPSLQMATTRPALLRIEMCFPATKDSLPQHPPVAWASISDPTVPFRSDVRRLEHFGGRC